MYLKPEERSWKKNLQSRFLPLPENKEPRYTNLKNFLLYSLTLPLGEGGISKICCWYQLSVRSTQSLSSTCSIWSSMRTMSIADWLLEESQELEVKGWVLNSEYSIGGYGMPLKKKDAGPRATSPGGNGYGDRRWNCVWLYFCPLSVYLSQDSWCCCFCHWNPHPQTRNISLLSQAH